MVDINLMGEEEESREESRPEESFAKTVNLDVGDTADEEKVSPFQREAAPGAYPRETLGSSFGRPTSISPKTASNASRNKAYLLVAALILAALVAVYFMIGSGKKKPGSSETAQPDLQPSEELATDVGTESGLESNIDTSDSAGVGETTLPPALTEPEATTPPATETLTNVPPAARSLYASTQLGAYTVGALGQSFSGANDFTLITFYGSNNSFLVEFSAPSSAAISEITQALQRNASPEELRTVSQLPGAGNGQSGNNIVISGKVNQRANMMGPQAGWQRMSFSEFSGWLKKLGADYSLRLKLFEAGQEYSDNGVSRTPVRVNFSGAKASIFDFLKGLADAGPTIAMSKIIVSSADRRASSSEILDLVLNFDFVEMQ